MENEKLKKIDDILKRTNCDFSTAKQALDATGDDVLDAIILIENNKKNQSKAQGNTMGNQIMNQLKDILEKGNTTKITIKRNNETIINLPIAAGIIGAVWAPILSAAGITAALLAQCSVEITQSDGKIIDLAQKMNQGKNAMKGMAQEVKQGASNLKDEIVEEASDLKDDMVQGANDLKEDMSNRF